MGPVLQQSELSLPTEEIDMLLENIDEWVAPESKSVPLLQFPGNFHVF